MIYKKTLLILTLVLLASCSSDNEDSNSNNNSINPPDWIQGSWFQEDNGTIDKNNGYTFKKNDFCLNVFNTQTCFGANYSIGTQVNAIIKIEEVKNDIEYKISIIQNNSTLVYHFKKITATKIEWINDPLGDLVDTYFKKI